MEEDTFNEDEHLTLKGTFISILNKHQKDAELASLFTNQEIVSETFNYFCLAANLGQIKRAVAWLKSIIPADQLADSLIELISSRKITSSRTAGIYMAILMEVDGLARVSGTVLTAMLEALSLKNLCYLPKYNKDISIVSKASLASFKLAYLTGQTVPFGTVSAYLQEFKGTTEELSENLDFVPLCTFSKEGEAELKATVERLLLRSAANACVVIGKLKLLSLVSEQFLPLLTNESDAIREAALSAFLANPFEPVCLSKLVALYNAKGTVLKSKITLSEAISQYSEAEEAKTFAKVVVAKEVNEQIVAKLLPLVSNDKASFAQFASAKSALKQVLTKNMSGDILAEFSKSIFDLVSKEVCPASAEVSALVCACLGKLAGLVFDWSKFLKESDAKPNSLLRKILEVGHEGQIDVVHWCLGLDKEQKDPLIAKVITNIAIYGHGQARRHALLSLTSAENLRFDLGTVCSNIDSSLNSWKLLKAMIKTESDAVAMFLPCQSHGHNWLVLVSSAGLHASVHSILEAAFEVVFKPEALTDEGLAILAKFAPQKLQEATNAFCIAALSSLDRVKLGVAAKLVRYSDCENLGLECFRVLGKDCPVNMELSTLLYTLGKSWRPLVASVILRNMFGDATPLVDKNWNMNSASAMEESAKRLFIHTKPLQKGVVYFTPLFCLWLKREDFNFSKIFADHLEDLSIMTDIGLVVSSRLYLVKHLLSFHSRTPDVDKIMRLVGGEVASEEEAQVFLDALFSEQPAFRRTAIEGLHTSWTVSEGSTHLHQFLLAVKLLKSDELCMQAATAVELKLCDSISKAAQPSEEESIQQLCALLEAKPADSWTIEAAKEAIASFKGEVAIEVLLTQYFRLLKERRPEIVNVRSKDLDLTKATRAYILEVLGMVDLPDQPDLIFRLFRHVILDFFFDPAKGCCEIALQTCLSVLESIPAERMSQCYGHEFGQVLECFLSGALKPVPTEYSVEDSDRARVFAIIILGKVSPFLTQNEERKSGIIKTMIDTLKTPAETVQHAVAEALIPLFTSLPQTEANNWFAFFKASIFVGTLAQRRGMAYGLAALVKAKGLMSIKQWAIMDLLLHPLRSVIAKSEVKPTTEEKESAIFGLELIARFLGQSFEPYVMKTIDPILTGFSDGRTEVREATFDAARSLMGCVSSAGARLLLPALLKRASVEDASWRARVGVLEWLGAMASMAPSVLATRLPEIIPILIDTGLNDSHGQVQAAAKKSLIEYGKAASNPEMRSLVPSILEALSDPTHGTIPCFRKILDTRFAHVIDGPSLALLEPLLRRALIDRSSNAATLKKLAGQIIGNLATSLVDASDFGPYLSTLTPSLCGCLGDPVPQVRAHAAKVLGMLVHVAEVDGRKASLQAVGNLWPSLEGTLFDPSTDASRDIDRTGAAQAISEIMAAKGTAFAKGVLEDEVRVWLKGEPAVKKEGALLVLGYLPGAFEFYDRLSELYCETAIPELLSETLHLTACPIESVRNSANKTGKALVEQFINTGIDRPGIFARLLAGFGSSQWRVRLACLSLLEKAMTSYEQEGEEDDEDLADNVVKVARLPTAEELQSSGIMNHGAVQTLQTRLYLARFDPASSQLRSIALNIWKALSYHSPRTLSEILPLLVREVASPATLDESAEQVRHALEDLFVKLGDRLALPFIVKSLEIFGDQSVSKAAILSNLAILTRVVGRSPEMFTKTIFDELMSKTVRAIIMGLTCEEDQARLWASKLFDVLVSEALKTPDLSGPIIKEIIFSPGFNDEALILLIGYKPAQMLSVVIPNVLECIPEDPSKLRLLGDIFEAAGTEAVSHVIPVTKALLAKYPEPNEELETTLRIVLSTLNKQSGQYEGDYEDEVDQDTVYHLRFSQVLEGQVELGVDRAAWAFLLVRLYCEGSAHADLSRLYSVWLARLLMACFGADAEGRKDSAQARPALLALLAAPKSQQLANIVQLMRSPAGRLEKGKIGPLGAWHTPILTHLVKTVILPTLTSPILGADVEMTRAYACEVSISLLRISSASSAAASWGTSALTLLIGALIRVGSDRKATDSRIGAFAALLEALKIHSAALRPFFPQLQRLFSQAITTGDDEAVESSVQALGKLLPLLPKPEGLVQEWSAVLAVSEDGDEATDNIQRVTPAAKTAMLRCLALAISGNSDLGGKIAHLSGPLQELLRALAAHEEESVRLANIRVIEALHSADVLTAPERKALLDLATMLK